MGSIDGRVSIGNSFAVGHISGPGLLGGLAGITADTGSLNLTNSYPWEGQTFSYTDGQTFPPNALGTPASLIDFLDVDWYRTPIGLDWLETDWDISGMVSQGFFPHVRKAKQSAEVPGQPRQAIREVLQP